MTKEYVSEAAISTANSFRETTRNSTVSEFLQSRHRRCARDFPRSLSEIDRSGDAAVFLS